MILNYPERTTISNTTHMISTIDLIVVDVETPKIYNGCSLEKEFTN